MKGFTYCGFLVFVVCLNMKFLEGVNARRRSSNSPGVNSCDNLGCTEDEVCVMPHNAAPHCRELDPCCSYPCPEASQCRVVDGQPACLTCFRDGIFYKEGDVLADDCYPFMCQEGILKPLLNYTIGHNCTAPFEPFEDGCYLLVNDTKLNWCEARQHCFSLNGDLVTGPNYATILNYALYKNWLSGKLWIGARDIRWLDWKEMTNWGENEPDFLLACVHMYVKHPNGTYISDTPCHNLRNFICQLF